MPEVRHTAFRSLLPRCAMPSRDAAVRHSNGRYLPLASYLRHTFQRRRSSPAPVPESRTADQNQASSFRHHPFCLPGNLLIIHACPSLLVSYSAGYRLFAYFSSFLSHSMVCRKSLSVRSYGCMAIKFFQGTYIHSGKSKCTLYSMFSHLFAPHARYAINSVSTPYRHDLRGYDHGVSLCCV